MAKSNCLIVLSAAPQGVEANCFIQSIKLLNPAFNIQIASPEGRSTEFLVHDDNNQRWINDFKGRPQSSPLRLDTVEGSRYAALFVPDGLGYLYDLTQSMHVKELVQHFIKEKKPICAIGSGVGALCWSAITKTEKWSLSGFSLTAPSIYELVKTPNFRTLPIVLEEYIRSNGGTYSASKPGSAHVIIDRTLITGQNGASTVTAVQNLILLCNLRQGKGNSH